MPVSRASRCASPLPRLFREEDGATAFEYALLLGLLVIAMFTAINGLVDKFASICDTIVTTLDIEW